MLLFEIRVENHRKIADKNSAEPGGSHFLIVQHYQTIPARLLELANFVGEVLIEVDTEFTRNFIFHDYCVAEQPIDDRAAQAILV